MDNLITWFQNWSEGMGIIGNFFTSNPASTVGSVLSGTLIIGGVFLLLKNAFTGDEGVKTIKQISLISLIPIGLFAIAQSINFTNVESYLTNFFVVIRSLLYVWDFWIDVPLLIGLILASLTIMSAYWTFKAYTFFVRFFNTN